ncbi:MAG TPA: hypothetical protein PLW68_11445 [Casimicrobiaceae bacterium]|nr:hypothetical protein [Casimicrobiaceae bacterium]
MKDLDTLRSMQNSWVRSLVCAALFLMCGFANATPIYAGSMAVTAGDPTQLGRLSRNGTPQDWTGGEPFPGVINAATAYHYTTIDLNLDALMAAYMSFGGFLQINFDSTSTNTFLSAYLDSYDSTNLAANWLGDPGLSGNNFGNPLFFQVLAGSGHHLLLVLNETTTNGAGLNQFGDVLVEAFSDTEYTDLVPRSNVPEPAPWQLVACSVALLASRRFWRVACRAA